MCKVAIKIPSVGEMFQSLYRRFKNDVIVIILMSILLKLKKIHTSSYTNLRNLNYGLLIDHWLNNISSESEDFSNILHLHPFELVNYHLQEYGPPVILCSFISIEVLSIHTLASLNYCSILTSEKYDARPRVRYKSSIANACATWSVCYILAYCKEIDWKLSWLTQLSRRNL